MFVSKTNFTNALRLHRNEIVSHKRDLSASVEFYQRATSWLWKQLASSIQNTMHGAVWRQLLGYKLLLRAMENYGQILTIGRQYFIKGRLDSPTKRAFQRHSAIAKDNIHNSMCYSKTIRTEMLDYVTNDANANATSRYIAIVDSLPVYDNASQEAATRWEQLLKQNDEFLESVRLKLLRDIYRELDRDTVSANSKSKKYTA